AGIGARVRLLGWRDDPATIVGDLDVLLLTSLHEGLPRVVPEAMAAGKPVVATAVDGTPEAVADGETGFLRAARDVEGLAAAVASLLDDPALARRMGAAGAARAGEWDIDDMVRRQEALYERLLAAAARRG
ncbi:glycosyltransferase, partial [bacterium]|nr:glycosyltransferase [bacterium]